MNVGRIRVLSKIGDLRPMVANRFDGKLIRWNEGFAGCSLQAIFAHPTTGTFKTATVFGIFFMHKPGDQRSDVLGLQLVKNVWKIDRKVEYKLNQINQSNRTWWEDVFCQSRCCNRNQCVAVNVVFATFDGECIAQTEQTKFCYQVNIKKTNIT